MSSSTQTGAVLVLGGTGKVGGQIAPLLHAAGVPTLVASRSGEAPSGAGTGVKFDWDDETTWEPVFANPVKAVFLVASRSPDPVPIMTKFVDFARAKGVSRFVLLSASSIEEGGPLTGGMHKYLRELGDGGKIGWAVLRPTWFQENFLIPPHVGSIKEENKIYSATGAGRIPWVSTRDIAAVGVHALTAAQPPNTDLLILGPELLTYSDLAATLTSILGRKIEYHELSEAELAARYETFGIPGAYATVLAAMDTAIKGGSEDRTSAVIREITGKVGRRFAEFVEANKAAWS
ncbi:putative ergot alkaloid A [Hypomontagnella monticulosa]|nr:putative ergot alkaloid A [Hypomontagnella monticulosa]